MSELDPIPEGQRLASEAASEMDAGIRAIRRQQRGLWVELAERLYHFRRGEMWKDLGVSSFEAWCADPEVDLERRWIYKLTDAYEFLVIRWGVPRERVEELKISKVNEVMPAIRRGQVELEVALSDIEVLGRHDLEEKYRRISPITGAPDTRDSVIRTENEPELAVCPTCGSTYRRRST